MQTDLTKTITVEPVGGDPDLHHQTLPPLSLRVWILVHIRRSGRQLKLGPGRNSLARIMGHVLVRRVPKPEHDIKYEKLGSCVIDTIVSPGSHGWLRKGNAERTGVAWLTVAVAVTVTIIT